MNRRLHKALSQTSELKALVVLLILWVLRCYRRAQSAWRSLPNILQVVQSIRAYVLSSRWFDRRRIHWVGYPISHREREMKGM